MKKKRREAGKTRQQREAKLAVGGGPRESIAKKGRNQKGRTKIKFRMALGEGSEQHWVEEDQEKEVDIT